MSAEQETPGKEFKRGELVEHTILGKGVVQADASVSGLWDRVPVRFLDTSFFEGRTVPVLHSILRAVSGQ
jgi:hypothetical protein